ncbi:MAG: hypothetical protein WD269_03785 [Acidimicrobiia bacterium]
MTQADKTTELMGVLVETARAHHAATGGPNPRWAEWYANNAIHELNRLLDSEMTVDELTDWLIEADRRYTAEQPDKSWPRAYATWLLEEVP